MPRGDESLPRYAGTPSTTAVAHCALAERLFPLDGFDDVLPAGHVLGCDLIEAARNASRCQKSAALCRYAQYYHGGSLHVLYASSRDKLPALVDGVANLYSPVHSLKLRALLERPWVTEAVVIINQQQCSSFDAAFSTIFDALPGSMMKAGMTNNIEIEHTAEDEQDGPSWDEEIQPWQTRLLKLRMIRRVLNAEPSEGIGEARLFDKLGFHARCMAISLQEELKMTTPDGSRFPLMEEIVRISAVRLHGQLRRATGPHVALPLEAELGEALEAIDDYSRAGLLYSEIASSWREMMTATSDEEEAAWLRSAALIQFHNSGLAFKRCSSFAQAEAAYVKAVQLAETRKQRDDALEDMHMVWDVQVDLDGVRDRAECLRCSVALQCLRGQRAANHAELLLPAYYLSKKARTRFLDSLHGPHGLAADPAAMCRAILSTTNPRQTLFEHASSPPTVPSEGMRPGMAYETLVGGKNAPISDVALCAGCFKLFDSSKLLSCACRADGATYCSKKCQLADWPTHKLTCAARKANKTPAAPPEEGVESARQEMEAMRVRADEREATDAMERKATEKERRARIAKQRADRAAAANVPPAEKTHAAAGTKPKDKENAAVAPAESAAQRAKRQASKAKGLEAQRQHEALLKGQEERRVAEAMQRDEMCKLGGRIAHGD